MSFQRRPAALVALVAVEGVAVVAVHHLGSRAPFDLPFDQLDPWLRGPGRRARRGHCARALVVRVVAAAPTLRTPARAARIPSAAHASGQLPTRFAVRSIALAALDGGRRSPRHSEHSPSVARPTLLPSVIVDVRDGEGSIHCPRTPPSARTSLSSCRDVPSRRLPNRSISRHVVADDGDNLWDLSAAALHAMARKAPVSATTRSRGTGASCAMPTAASLRSGDVNLIYPGESCGCRRFRERVRQPAEPLVALGHRLQPFWSRFDCDRLHAQRRASCRAVGASSPAAIREDADPSAAPSGTRRLDRQSGGIGQRLEPVVDTDPSTRCHDAPRLGAERRRVRATACTTNPEASNAARRTLSQ